MIQFRHVLLHAQKLIIHSLRTGSGVAFIFLTILIGLSLANLSITPVELGFTTAEEFRESASKAIGFALATASLRMGVEDENLPPDTDILSRMESGDLIDLGMWARYLILDNPMLLSITVLLLGVVLPLILPLGSFTAISSDVQHRTVRYLLPRTSRLSLLVGRWLGTLFLSWVLILLLLFSVVVYLSIMLPPEATESMVPWAGRCLFSLCCLATPYVSLGVLCSAVFRVPMVALLAAVGATVGTPLLALSLQEAWDPLGNLLYLLPWGYSHELLSPDGDKVFKAVAYSMGHSLLFMTLAAWRFRRADL